MAVATYTTTALAGVLSHLLYFRYGEHGLRGLLYLRLLTTAILTATVFLSYKQDIPLTTALFATTKLTASYLTGLYTSLLTYRVFFHPLNKFPGSLGARISSCWLATQLNHDLYLKLLQYHSTLGPFVRIGSSDLSVSHPDAIEALLGPKSLCIKGELYDLSSPGISLQLIRDPEFHHARRRVWSGAFSDRLLRGYEQRVQGYRSKLLSHFTDAAGKHEPVDVRKWFDLYSFDVMGDLSFGKGFDSLERGEEHWVVRLLNSSQAAIGLYLPAWLFVLLVAVPGLAGDFWKFYEYCGQRLMARFKTDPDIPDISSSLFVPLEGKNLDELGADEKNLLYGDARLIVIAGSDTTSNAFTALIYELLKNPEHITKLRAELEPYATEGTDFLNSKIAHLDHLNGVINEALRLYPAVPSGLQRKTPPQGIDIAGVHVPGNMHVSCPLYVVHRSELAYARPTEFIPERWYSQPELIKHKNAFAPFSIGPFNCIGRPLALMNLRTTLAQLVMEFDMKFAPGEDGSRFLGDAQDNFVFYAGKLEVSFTKRER